MEYIFFFFFKSSWLGEGVSLWEAGKRKVWISQVPALCGHCAGFCGEVVHLISGKSERFLTFCWFLTLYSKPSLVWCPFYMGSLWVVSYIPSLSSLSLGRQVRGRGWRGALTGSGSHLRCEVEEKLYPLIHKPVFLYSLAGSQDLKVSLKIKSLYQNKQAAEPCALRLVCIIRFYFLLLLMVRVVMIKMAHGFRILTLCQL